MLISRKTPKEEVLALGRIECNNCTHCCKYGSGYLVPEDLPKIAKFLRITQEELKKKFLEEAEKFNTTLLRPKIVNQGKPYGRCVFLDEKSGCTIQEVKPLHCKIGACNIYSTDLQKWFDLNHFVNKEDPESIRQYAIYLEFNEPLPGGKLEDLVPDKEHLKKIMSYEIIK